jgi:hypothetical protein
MYAIRHVNCLIFSSDFNQNYVCSTNVYSKSLHENILRRPFHWESTCSMRTDGQTDRQTDGPMYRKQRGRFHPFYRP